MGNLGGLWTPVVGSRPFRGDSTVPCRYVSDLQPVHPWQPASATAL